MKNLFKLAAIAVVMLASCPVFAQTEEAVQAPAAEPEAYKVYCEIVGNRIIFSQKMNVELDFGQFSSWWTTDRRLADEQGNAIIFNSMLDAANYMARRGWVLEEAFVVTSIITGDSSDP